MKRVRASKADLIIIVAFLLLPLILFGDVTIGGQTMVPVDNLFQWQPWASAADELGVGTPHNPLLSDLVLQNYVWKQFIRQSLAAPRAIPLWNPHLFGGAPFLAAGQNAAYYPFSIVFLALPLAAAYGWYTLSQLWLAGVFMYFLGRVLGMRRAGAALAGLVFQGSGFLLVSAAVFPMILGAAIWLPLLLAAIEMIIRASTSPRGAGRTLPWAVLGALGLGCQLLAGHIEITYYTLLVTAAYAMWRLFTRLRRRRHLVEPPARGRWYIALLKPTAWLMAVVIVGIMLGGIQFIPFYEVGQVNFREGSATLAEVRGWAFPARRLLTFVLPNFFGNPAHHGYFDLLGGDFLTFTTNYYGEVNPNAPYSSAWGIKNYVEGGIYLGILPLLLAALGLWSARRPSLGRRSAILFFALLTFFSVAFVFGTPLYGLLFYGLPGINQLHSPFRWVFPLSLAIAALAGYGADHLVDAGRESQAGSSTRRMWASDRSAPRLLRPFVLWGRPSTITVLGGLAFWAGMMLLAALTLSRLFYGPLEPLVEGLFLGLAKAPEAFATVGAFYSYQARNFFILSLMLVGSGIVLRVSRCPFTLPRRPQSPLWPLLAFIVILLDLLLANAGFHTAADPTLLDYRPQLVEWLAEQPGLWRLTTFDPHGNKHFNANAAWLYGFQDVRGYDSIIPRQYTDYMAAIEPQNELLFNRVQPVVDWRSLNSPLLDLLGVRYIITSETLDLPKLALAWEGEELRVYENLAAVPRAYTLPRRATAVVDDPLAAMNRLDPRQYVVVAEEDWPGEEVGKPIPSTLEPAKVAAYDGGEVVVEANVAEPSWLVLGDSHFPGWKLFVSPQGSGQSAEREHEIIRVNGNFRGALLEPGAWTLRFRYSPLSFKVGGLTSAMGAIILLFAVAVWGWRQLYDPEVELTNTLSIAKNSMVPMALNLLNRFIDFLYAAFYLRLLGPADAGSYFTAITIASWFEIISNFGLNTLIIREVSQQRSQASHYLLNTILLRVGTSAVAAIPVFLYFGGVDLLGQPLSAETTAAILLFMVGMLFSGAGQSFSGLFYAFETAEVPAAIQTVTTILKVGFGVLALLLGYGFVGLAAVSILVSLITLLVLGVAAFRQLPLHGPWRLDIRFQRQMVSTSFPLMLNHLLAVVFFFIDVPLMQQINGERTVGWYNTAYKWINAINVIPSFFTIALFPIISRQIQSDMAGAVRSFRMSIKLMALISLPTVLVTTMFAFPLVSLLGGEAFLPHGAWALQIMIWSIPIGWINSVTNYVLIALGQERVQVRAFVVGVVFNLVANLIFLEMFSYVAAATITILSEIVLLVVFNHYLKPQMPGVRWASWLWRPGVATAAMALGLWVGTFVHPAASLLLGAFLYAGTLWLLGALGEDERRVLQAILPAPLLARLVRP